jgi:hypothetical protein
LNVLISDPLQGCKGETGCRNLAGDRHPLGRLCGRHLDTQLFKNGKN